MADKRTISVFIASPGDLSVERQAFRDCIDELNKGFGMEFEEYFRDPRYVSMRAKIKIPNF